MKFEQIRIEETAPWLSKAKSDLAVAEVIFRVEPPFYAQCLFHCQQSVEKSLKAFLTWHDVPFRKTHDLKRIGRQCAKIDPQMEKLLKRAAPLSKYAWQLRYPGEDEEPNRRETHRGLSTARQIFKMILKKIPRPAHP